MKKNKGDQAELLAVKYLQKNNYEILARNWRYKRAEIDIIALKNCKIYVVEVKYRQYNAYLYNENLISFKKRRLLMMGANAFLLSKSLDFSVQFDTIFVLDIVGKIEVIHIPCAFTQLDS